MVYPRSTFMTEFGRDLRSGRSARGGNSVLAGVSACKTVLLLLGLNLGKVCVSIAFYAVSVLVERSSRARSQ